MTKPVYFLKRGEKLIGPHNLETIKKLSESLKIKPSDLIAKSKDGPWHKFGDVEEKLYTSQKKPAAEQSAARGKPANPSLMDCPDCSGKMSKRAAACPHCGAPNSDASQNALPPFQDASFGNLDVPPVGTPQAVVTSQPRYLQASTQQQNSTSKSQQEDQIAKEEGNGGALPFAIAGSFLGVLLLLGLLAFGLNALLFNPVAIKQRQVDRIFSGPDGSSPVIVKDIKEFLLDPQSFEHVSTEYGHQNRDDFDEGALIVRVKFRAKSRLGASVLGEKYYEISYSNEIVGDGPVGPPQLEPPPSYRPSTVEGMIAARETRWANDTKQRVWERFGKPRHDQNIDMGWNAVDVVASIDRHRAARKSDTENGNATTDSNPPARSETEESFVDSKPMPTETVENSSGEDQFQESTDGLVSQANDAESLESEAAQAMNEALLKVDQHISMRFPKTTRGNRLVLFSDGDNGPDTIAVVRYDVVAFGKTGEIHFKAEYRPDKKWHPLWSERVFTVDFKSGKVRKDSFFVDFEEILKAQPAPYSGYERQTTWLDTDGIDIVYWIQTELFK